MQNQPNDTAAFLAALRAEMQQLMHQGGDWEAFALKVFRFQCAHNAIYGAYVRLRGVDPEAVTSTSEVPYLPSCMGGYRGDSNLCTLLATLAVATTS